jgi:hypothetical protein
MPIGAARKLRDLVNEDVEQVFIDCEKCDRAGCYLVAGLVIDHGPMCRLSDLLAYFARPCPWRKGQGVDGCGAVFRFDPK